MVCAHCGHQNDDGRKYCRGCAKPLVPKTAQTSADSLPSATPKLIVMPEPTPTTTLEPKLNKMALASLLLSIFAFIVPLGLAAIVLGHISRVQTARSKGRQKGMATALAGLVIGYLQLTLVALVVVGMMSVWREFRGNLDRQPYLKDAILDRLAHGDPTKVTPERTARHHQNALAALRVIRIAEASYLAAHPTRGYACELYQAGLDSIDDTEWKSLVVNSDYDIKILRCSLINGPNYVVLAIPRSDGNPADAPVYCLDPANGIESYNTEQARDAIPTVVTRVTEPCPLTGTHVD
jgi:Domain of unknown function (DUF4190)